MTDTTRLASSSRELPLEPGGEVQVLLTSSEVRLRGTDEDRVVVRTRDGEDLDDEVVLEAGPGRVRIQDADRGLRLGPVRLRAHGSASLDIEIPRSARLSFKTLSGDVEAVEVGGESRWSSASGDLRLVVTGGSHTVDSMSGDVTIEATGAIGLRARSVSGNLRIRAPRVDSLGASTTSGDIRIDADLGAAGDHEVSSVSGDVELVSRSPIRVETQTIAGDVRALGTYVAEGGRGRRTIVVGDGSIRVSIRTTSGDIAVRGDGAAPAGVSPVSAPPVPVAPAAPIAPAAPTAPVAPAAPPLPRGDAGASRPDPSYVVAEAEAAPNLVRPAPAPAVTGDEAGGERPDAPADEPGQADGADRAGLDDPEAAMPAAAWQGGESPTDRREAARLDILRALERGELDIDAASHRLEQLEEAGPRYFRGWC